MIEMLKFERKNSEYKYTSYSKEWQSECGIHYVSYPFMIYKDEYTKKWKLTHLSSGALICSTDILYGAKYIATRLLPIPQFLLPHTDLVKYMSEEQRRYCTDIIARYRNETKNRVDDLDKNCPFSI